MEKKKQFLMKQKEHLNRGKRGILSVIFGRTGILLILILLQIGLLLVGFRFLSNYVFAIYGGAMVLGFLLSVYLINQKGYFQSSYMISLIIIYQIEITYNIKLFKIIFTNCFLLFWFSSSFFCLYCIINSHFFWCGFHFNFFCICTIIYTKLHCYSFHK